MSKQRIFGRSRPSKPDELFLRKEVEKLVNELNKDVERQLTEKELQTVQEYIATFKDLRKTWYYKFHVRGRELAKWLADRTRKRTNKQIMKKLHETGLVLTPQYTEEDLEKVSDMTGWIVEQIEELVHRDLKIIQKTVVQAFRAGGDSHLLNVRVKAWLGDYTNRQNHHAELITRDIMNKTTQSFAILEAHSLGITKARWIHVPGYRSSRRTHIKMDKQIFDLSQGLYDSDVGHYVMPAELKYCNCQFEAVIPGFEDD